MLHYKNIKTGAVLETFGEISGENYQIMKEEIGKTEIIPEESTGETVEVSTEEPVKKARGRKPKGR